MATRALGATGEAIANNVTLVSSALNGLVTAFLPLVNDGSGVTVAVGTEIRFVSTVAPIEVLTNAGVRVGNVPAYGQAVAVARRGAAQAAPDDWNFQVLAQAPADFLASGASYSQADSQAIVACLVNAGLMKAE